MSEMFSRWRIAEHASGDNLATFRIYRSCTCEGGPLRVKSGGFEKLIGAAMVVLGRPIIC
jgi:hypothetical protein